ncbi:hypothetical protein [Pseudomonas asplenii]|uniref:hypothetical protein n=1 Tax=Pseudomonas asplenii TaxID=53407 RepID=UPI0012FAE892|nr:hypothetical protein [Pseudomonas fuscovaginae]
MNLKARATAIEMCANVQRKGYQYYAQRGILRSTNRPIESLLGCTHQPADGYSEPCDGFAAEARGGSLSLRYTESFFEVYEVIL